MAKYYLMEAGMVDLSCRGGWAPAPACLPGSAFLLTYLPGRASLPVCLPACCLAARPACLPVTSARRSATGGPRRLSRHPQRAGSR